MPEKFATNAGPDVVRRCIRDQIGPLLQAVRATEADRRRIMRHTDRLLEDLDELTEV